MAPICQTIPNTPAPSVATTPSSRPSACFPPTVRLARVNWLSALERSPSQAPLVSAEFVAGLGRSVRLVDVRTEHELTGPMGHIPGSDWVPVADFDAIRASLGRDEPLVLIAHGDERSMALAKRLEESGLRMVAALRGGILCWRAMGYTTSRDGRLQHRRGQLRHLPASSVPTDSHALGIDEVRAHIGDPFAVRTMKMSAMLLHGRLSCVDGRDDTGGVLALALQGAHAHDAEMRRVQSSPKSATATQRPNIAKKRSASERTRPTR